MTGTHNIPVQVIAATHSALVLASVEPRFDEEKDAIWELDLHDGEVELREHPWSRRGHANAWLTSSVFDLIEPRSIEAEAAIVAALSLARQPSPPIAEMDRVEAMLKGALSDIDRFWVRWAEFRRRAGKAS